MRIGPKAVDTIKELLDTNRNLINECRWYRKEIKEIKNRIGVTQLPSFRGDVIELKFHIDRKMLGEIKNPTEYLLVECKRQIHKILMKAMGQ